MLEKLMEISDNLNELLEKLSEIIYSRPLYFGSLQLVELFILVKLLYWDNLFNLSVKYPIFTQLFVLSTIFFYILLFFFLTIKSSKTSYEAYNVPTEKNIFKKACSILSFLAFILFIIYGFVWIIHYYFDFFRGKIFHYLMFFFLLISTISLIYTVFKKQIDKLLNITLVSFLLELILFLPCLLLRFIDYVKYQCKITTKPIWLLLGIETILIMLWFLVPKMLGILYTHTDSAYLLKDPIYLNHMQTLGTFEQLYVGDNKTPSYNYHYSLSAWFYINPQPPATSAAYTKYTNILNYGGKPSLQYNGQLNSLRVVAATGDGNEEVVIFETTDVIYQKWNHIVINYEGGTMDVFLNGELVGSLPNVVSYMSYDNIDVGTEDGIQGGICNVVYYRDNLPKSKIAGVYRLLRNKKVPL